MATKSPSYSWGSLEPLKHRTASAPNLLSSSLWALSVEPWARLRPCCRGWGLRGPRCSYELTCSEVVLSLRMSGSSLCRDMGASVSHWALPHLPFGAPDRRPSRRMRQEKDHCQWSTIGGLLPRSQLCLVHPPLDVAAEPARHVPPEPSNLHV